MTTPASGRKDAEGQPESGFSLVEVLIAILILVFGIVAVANLILVAATSNMTANSGTTAATVASEEMERLKALSFAAVAAEGGTRVVEGAVEVQVSTTVRPLGPNAFHIIVVATPLTAFTTKGNYNVGPDPDVPRPTRGQAVYTTVRVAE
jgi:prepilin-type N-terminal cleavage/methylation domain-containing protein